MSYWTVIYDLAPLLSAPKHRACRKCNRPFEGSMATNSGLDSGLCQYCHAIEAAAPPGFGASSGGAYSCDEKGEQMVSVPCGHGGSLWFYGRIIYHGKTPPPETVAEAAADEIVKEFWRYLRNNSDYDVTRAGGPLKQVRNAIERYLNLRGGANGPLDQYEALVSADKKETP